MTLEQARAIKRSGKAPTLRQAIEIAVIDLDDLADPQGEFCLTEDAVQSVVRELRRALDGKPY